MAKVLVIAGPTAAGKSATALHLAQMLNGEIINADSVQVYRGLDIGAAKPSASERAAVIHHLLDIADPRENYTVARYQKDAAAAIVRVHSRGRLPILVGGTGLYIRAVVRGYAFSESGMDEELRSRLRTEAEALGPAALHNRLSQLDPDAAARLHPNDVRRVIRALEVYEQTQTPISRQVEQTQPNPAYDVRMIGITLEREVLYRRIEQRVDRMLEAGLVTEVRSLLESGVPPQAKAMQSLGYRQIVAFLQGDISLAEATEQIKRDTRRFAKRQLTWFRREPGMAWYPADAFGSAHLLAENISYYLAGDYK
jgi:tRNA dimethylallyltransferase